MPAKTGILAAALVAVGLAAAAFLSNTSADTVNGIYFDASDPDGSCEVHGDSGTLATVTVKGPDPERFANAYACSIPCADDLGCWIHGSIFIHFDALVDEDPLAFSYTFNNPRGARSYTYIDDEFDHAHWWITGGNYYSEYVGVFEENTSVDVYGTACYDVVAPMYEITMADTMAAINAFGDEKQSPPWNNNADVNSDESVTLADIMLITSQFGLNCAAFVWPPEE